MLWASVSAASVIAVYGVYYYVHPRFQRWLFLPVVVFTLAYGLHLFPALPTLNVGTYVLSADAVPYQLRFDFTKLIIAFAVTTFCFTPKPIYSIEIVDAFVILAMVSMLFFFAVVSGYVSFDNKTLSAEFFILWCFHNLFFVVLGEEMFFRRFVQTELTRITDEVYAVFIAAFAFGLAHIGGGVVYVCLATMAGITYGYIYMKTNRIETAVLLHFIVNLIHLFMFTYPSLAT